MGCALKNFFILLLFCYIPLSLGDEVLDIINTLDGRVLKLEEQNQSKERRIHNLEMTNLELVTAIQVFDIKLRESQEQLNVSSSANNLLEQKVKALDGQLEHLGEFTNLVLIPESCGKLSLLGITKSMESLIDPDGKGENNAPIKVSTVFPRIVSGETIFSEFGLIYFGHCT